MRARNRVPNECAGAGLVNIRAVRHKPPHKTTEEIL